MASTRTSLAKGPTVATLRAVEDVLRAAATPMTRYAIRKALGDRVGAPALDEALSYMASHEMVYDEGAGGMVLWIRASAATLSKLRGA
jgi:hypothetical protein